MNIARRDIEGMIEGANRGFGRKVLALESHNPGDGNHYHLTNDNGSHDYMQGSNREVYQYVRGVVESFDLNRKNERHNSSGFTNQETLVFIREVGNFKKAYDEVQAIANQSDDDVERMHNLEAWYSEIKNSVAGDNPIHLLDDAGWSLNFVIDVGSSHRLNWREILGQFSQREYMR